MKGNSGAKRLKFLVQTLISKVLSEQDFLTPDGNLSRVMPFSLKCTKYGKDGIIYSFFVSQSESGNISNFPFSEKI